MIEQAVIDAVVERVVEIAQPQKVILFGSAARGDMGPHSDIDLLVIKDGVDARDMMSRIHSNLGHQGVAVDVIVASAATVERYKDSHALVYKPALREGKVMYETSYEGEPDAEPLPDRELPPGRYPPDDPREWLGRAKGNLARAKVWQPGFFWEDLCFDAQQAAEKAIKARLIALDVEFPYTHKIEELLRCLEAAGDVVPDEVRAAEGLTRYAVDTRYGSDNGPVTEADYIEAIRAAEAVVGWIEGMGV